MLAKSYIESNLRSLRHKYRNAKTQNEPLFFAKLAIIELCGWIETAQDQVVSDCADRCLRTDAAKRKVRDHIEKNYGFSENRHFKNMLRGVIGWRGLETVEAACVAGDLESLYRNLNELSKERNKLAHTYVKGMMHTLESPDLTFRRYQQIYTGLVHLDERLKATGF